MGSFRLPDLVEHWFARLAEVRNLAGKSCPWLAERTGVHGSDLWRGWRLRPPHKRGLCFDSAFGADTTSPADLVCRTIVEHDFEQGSTAVGLWQRLLTVCRDDACSLFAGVSAIVASDAALAIFANVSANAVLEQVDAACKCFVSPRLSALLSHFPALLDSYFAKFPEWHAAHDGVILREAIDESAGEFAGQSCDVTAADETGRELVEDDLASNQAERFLFGRLQSLSDATGLFELNARVPTTGASGGASEADLLARSLRVAAEIDGYHHLNDLKAYRRDRHKDVLLQQSCHFVVRCLANNAASRLEEIVETILSTVRQQQAARSLTREQSS
jgi:hypothetical protein